MTRETLDLSLPDPSATERLAGALAVTLRPGDVVALSGDLGAGKTTLARLVIRALARDETLEVPSPTFTLVHSYDLAGMPLVHADLYRIGDPSELAELGIDEALDGGLALVEWPERGWPETDRTIRLALAFGRDPQARQATLSGPAARIDTLRRALAAGEFLAGTAFAGARRVHLQGDASTRRYERVEAGTGTALPSAILMDAPPHDDGASPRPGARSYADVAKLAKDVRAFVAVAHELRRRGLAAPEILAADLEAGFVLAQDFGDAKIAEGDAPVAERYLACAEVLAVLHREPPPAVLPLPGAGSYELRSFDMDVLIAELRLFVDWYAPSVGIDLSGAAGDGFEAAWREALAPLAADRSALVLRDFHSPNLLWRAGETGTDRIGLIDVQDALAGSPAYDLASLGQDARVTVPEPLETALLDRYADLRRRDDPAFDRTAFEAQYRLAAAQRATRILGTFTRLARRDGKPGYLAHLPRLAGYLARDLAHPALAAVEDWFRAEDRATRFGLEAQRATA